MPDEKKELNLFEKAYDIDHDGKLSILEESYLYDDLKEIHDKVTGKKQENINPFGMPNPLYSNNGSGSNNSNGNQ